MTVCGFSVWAPQVPCGQSCRISSEFLPLLLGWLERRSSLTDCPCDATQGWSLSCPPFSSVPFLCHIPEVRGRPLSFFYPTSCRPRTRMQRSGSKMGNKHPPCAAWSTSVLSQERLRAQESPTFGFQNQAGPSQSSCPLIGNRTVGLWL